MNPQRGRLGFGILAGAGTGVFWGIPFLAPQVLTQYSPVEIAFGRFFFFGIASALFIPQVFRLVSRLSWKERGRVVLLSASGFWFYSCLLFWGIRQTNGVVSSLILGMLPVTIPLFSPGRPKSGPGFFFGLMLIAVGLVSLVLLSHSDGGLPGVSGNGLLALFGCLGLWTAFAIFNSRFLQARPWISTRDFSSLMGLVSCGALIPVLMAAGTLPLPAGREDYLVFVGFSAALGLGASWFANWLWNLASAWCPSEISGTLLVFETVFGVLYTFVYEKRPPRVDEAAAIGLCLLGVGFAITSRIRVKLDQSTS